MHPHLELQQSPSVQHANEIDVDDTGALPNYANFCRVTATPEEVILDFGLNLQSFVAGRHGIKMNHRIVMNQYTTKRLLAAIGITIQRHEQTFGPIELDVNRRVTPRQLQFMPTGVNGQTPQPVVIKLRTLRQIGIPPALIPAHWPRRRPSPTAEPTRRYTRGPR